MHCGRPDDPINIPLWNRNLRWNRTVREVKVGHSLSTAHGNTGNLLDFEILSDNTGYLLEFNCSSWKLG